MQLVLPSESEKENTQGPLTVIDNGRGKGKGKASIWSQQHQFVDLAYQSCLFTDYHTGYLTMTQHPSIKLLINCIGLWVLTQDFQYYLFPPTITMFQMMPLPSLPS
jgi:hypothetical protein